MSGDSRGDGGDRSDEENAVGPGSEAGNGDPPGSEDGRGKVDREFFERVIAPRLGADRPDVALGPTYGVDFGVVSVGGRALVCATDPVSILGGLGWERAGRFAARILLADVAVSGLAPSHLTVGLHLPPAADFPDRAFERTWTAIDDLCRDLGVAVVAGHTGRYADCSLPWVGAGTAMAVGDPDRVVRPDGARPGDRLLVTTGPAVESAALLAALAPEAIDLPAAVLERAADRIDDLSVVRAAPAAAAAGPVTAMHDATERGVIGALREMAAGAGVRIDLRTDAAPLPGDIRQVCEAAGIDPWATGSAGTLLATVRPERVETVLSALDGIGVRAAVVGEVSAVDGDPDGGSGPDSESRSDGGVVYRDGDRATVPRRDPFAAAYADLVGDDGDGDGGR